MNRNNDKIFRKAGRTCLDIVLNGYCREFGNWSPYQGVPEYDRTLGEWIRQSGHDLHMRFDFTEAGSEVYAPLCYFSQAGEHVFGFPVLERELESDKIRPVDVYRFLELAVRFARAEFPRADPARARERLKAWTDRLAAFPASCLPAAGTEGPLDETRGGAEQRILQAVREAACREGITGEDAAARWFEEYLREQVSGLAARSGLAGTDSTHAAPADSTSVVPAGMSGVVPAGESRVPATGTEETLSGQRACAVLMERILRVTGILGRNRLAGESALLKLAYQVFSEAAQHDSTGLTGYLLRSRRIPLRARLLSSMLPGRPVRYREVPNPLHINFFSGALINPPGKEAVFSGYFPEEGIQVSIRPFDLERDLEMVHEWFHREHTRKIWQMDWPLSRLEKYYRMLLPGRVCHAYIGEINGEAAFNFEVYWAARDLLGDYYEVEPGDYGTHFMIAATDRKKKYPSASTRSMVEWIFSQPEVGKMVGEGSVESLAALMNKAHVGFRLIKVIDLPHKKANLNFCYREWYRAKFPEPPAAVRQAVNS